MASEIKSTNRSCLSPVAMGLFLAVGTLAAYAPALHGGFVWDDDMYVSENPTLADSRGLADIWFRLGATPQYYPLVFTSFWLERRLWGLNPFGYHVVNVLLHALGAFLLWTALQRLRIRGAATAAVIFALHPVHVESVAWITERKNVLSGVFYFASILAYCRFALVGADRGRERSGWAWYALALVLFFFALCGKTVTCSLPAVLALVLWWRRPRFAWRSVIPLIPMFALGAGMAMVTIWMERHHVGARGPRWDLSAAERCIIAGRAIWFYLAKLAWPSPLMFVYPKWNIDAGDFSQYLFPLSAVAVLIALWATRRRIGKGPLVAALFFIGTLFPALGFFNTFPMRYYYVADHFQYLASVGPIVLFSALTAWLWTRGRAPSGAGGRRQRLSLAHSWSNAAHTQSQNEQSRRLKPAARKAKTGNIPAPGSFVGAALSWAPRVVVPCLLAFLTWRQAAVYGDLKTLYRDTLAKNPQAVMTHNNLAMVLAEEGKLDDALNHLREAVHIDADFGEAQYNLGTTLSMLGRTDEAIRAYREAIRITPDNQKAMNNLANTFLQRGETAKAIAQYRALLRINPNHADGHANLGIALARLGRREEAVAEYRKALAADGNHVGAHYNLANALADLGRTEGAIVEYRRALALNPRLANAYYGLGTVLSRTGRFDEAKEAFRRAIELNPNDKEARQALERLR